MNVTDLKPNQKAIIKHIGDLGDLSHRLVELGITCGEIIKLVRVAPLGNPLEVKVHDERIVMRKEDAKKIEVEEL
ncbi:FeoA family protein [Sulfurimonas autotrophica]|uniref:FeoA family protein n=1 Tax=Sulfurimonas autotrophica (strain ATCC BAA-671 / DSM 16294 / JCM 11897 / OK10) TaxID=563040 RepID=E0UP89_SULAO|nr:FeoA family protein [Sulfurimonas autotrophica]ADN08553.1 FeoA family protein [Sulfurimonas autotrophica DSM 16294]